MPSGAAATAGRVGKPQGLATNRDQADRALLDIEHHQRQRDNERQRDNQRRSRARRKEVLDILQRKVEEYERKGVQATVEMQQAARREHWENQRLRELLRSKGVHDAEVFAWLQQGPQVVDDGGRAPLPAIIPAGPPSVAIASRVPITAMLNSDEDHTSPAGHRPNPASTWYDRQRTPLPHLRLGPLSPSSSTATDEFSAASRPPSSVLMDESNSSTSSASHRGTGEREPSVAEKVASCCTSGTETSCEVAAAILANMQGHGDTGRARVALGCEGPSACTVKNTRILELLDESG